jgi:SAM-dependent methyltransferase
MPRPPDHPSTRGDYEQITERPGIPISRIQLARGIHRYQTAAAGAEGKDVLEVACGSGQGLGLLGRRARRVVGGDYVASNLRLAREHYGTRATLVQLDAETLPFGDGTFDVVVLLEAIYYLSHADRFIAETVRVLRRPGRVIISSVNCAWPDFGRSPYATKYFDTNELRALLRDAGVSAEIFGAFAERGGLVASARSLIRRAAFRWRLVPGSLRARGLLKRLVHGPLQRQPAELPADAQSEEPLVPIPPGVRDTEHSILYAVGTR